MKDPTTMWAAQAAEERRRLLEASRPDEQRAEWADDRAANTAASSSRPTARLAGLVGRLRQTLHR